MPYSSIHYALSFILNSLPSNANRKLFVGELSYQNATVDDFHNERKPSCANTKMTCYAVSRDEGNTEEDSGKSMMNVLCVLQCAKRHILGWSDVNQAHTTVLAVIKFWRCDLVHCSALHRILNKCAQKYTEQDLIYVKQMQYFK